MNKYQEKIKECLHKLAENTPGRYCTKEELNNLGKYVLEICDKADKYDDKETALTLNYIADGYADGYPVYDTAECSCGEFFEIEELENKQYNYCPYCGQKWNKVNLEV